METQRSSKLPLQKLEKCNFRIMLKCRSEDESSDYNFFTTIKALSRVCKSIISLSKGTLNMGDCTIGSVKNSSFQVTNLSDLPAHLELEFVSKVVSCFPMTPVVPPHQTQEFKIRMLPRKINPNYKKVITVVNKDSGAEDLPLEVSANNMDTHGVLSHSRFYRIDTKLSSNVIKFEQLIVNSVALREFTIENITEGDLEVSLFTSNPGDVQLFIKNKEDTEEIRSFKERNPKWETIFQLSKPHSEEAATQREKPFKTVGSSRILRGNALSPKLEKMISAHPSTDASSSSKASRDRSGVCPLPHQQLMQFPPSPAVSSSSSEQLRIARKPGRKRREVRELESGGESSSRTPRVKSSCTDESREVAIVREEIERNKLLERAIRCGLLQSIEQLELSSHQRVCAYVRWKCSDIDRERKFS
eukprot:364374_1